MPSALINGLKVNYAVQGEGRPLLMLAPGGFDSTLESWWTRGVSQQNSDSVKRRILDSVAAAGKCA